HAGGGGLFHWETETRLWDVGEGQARELGSFAASPTFSPDGKGLAVPTEDGGALPGPASPPGGRPLQHPGGAGWSRLWSYNGYKAYPTAQFSPDSRLVAVTGLFDGRERGPVAKWLSRHVAYWPTQRWGNIARVWDAETGREQARLSGCKEVVFSP